MSLDSKQKRGSAVHIADPARQWLTEPTGTIGAGPRLSLVKFCSAIAAATITVSNVLGYRSANNRPHYRATRVET